VGFSGGTPYKRLTSKTLTIAEGLISAR